MAFAAFAWLCHLRKTQTLPKNINRHLNSPGFFDNEQYMIPVLSNDTLLYALDSYSINTPNSISAAISDNKDQQIEALSAQIAHYKMLLNTNIDSDLIDQQTQDNTQKYHDDEYFKSYGYNDIHETMLKDM